MKRIQEITYELKTGQGWTLAEGSQNKFYVQKTENIKMETTLLQPLFI